MVPPGVRVADVACGDGQLTALLRTAGHVVIPTELPGPASRARERLGDVRVGDGLRVLAPGEVDVVVIAGLGGGTMRRLLEDSPDVVAAASLLVLQPMRPLDPLLDWVAGRELVGEAAAVERGRTYRVLAVRGGNA